MQISLLLHHKNGSEQTMYCQCMILCSVVLVPGSNTIFDGQNMRIIFTKTRKCGYGVSWKKVYIIRQGKVLRTAVVRGKKDDLRTFSRLFKAVQKRTDSVVVLRERKDNLVDDTTLFLSGTER